jgi:DNA adenine methylase
MRYRYTNCEFMFDFGDEKLSGQTVPTVQSGIVNVATVPHRSPFRYPGGKTWLIPRIRQWLLSTERPRQLIEPFAGGGIVGLSSVFEDLVDTVCLVELDEDVAAVWRTMLSGCGHTFAERVRQFCVTPESIDDIVNTVPLCTFERAFATIVKNRVNRGGILAPGVGLMKNGENGKGLLSRWYPETLSKRIIDISNIRDRISFVQGDGIEVMRKNAENDDVVFFIDPPYTVAGKRLYRNVSMI